MSEARTHYGVGPKFSNYNRHLIVTADIDEGLTQWAPPPQFVNKLLRKGEPTLF